MDFIALKRLRFGWLVEGKSHCSSSRKEYRQERKRKERWRHNLIKFLSNIFKTFFSANMVSWFNVFTNFILFPSLELLLCSIQLLFSLVQKKFCYWGSDWCLLQWKLCLKRWPICNSTNPNPFHFGFWLSNVERHHLYAIYLSFIEQIWLRNAYL